MVLSWHVLSVLAIDYFTPFLRISYQGLNLLSCYLIVLVKQDQFSRGQGQECWCNALWWTRLEVDLGHKLSNDIENMDSVQLQETNMARCFYIIVNKSLPEFFHLHRPTLFATWSYQKHVFLFPRWRLCAYDKPVTIAVSRVRTLMSMLIGWSHSQWKDIMLLLRWSWVGRVLVVVFWKKFVLSWVVGRNFCVEGIFLSGDDFEGCFCWLPSFGILATQWIDWMSRSSLLQYTMAPGILSLSRYAARILQDNCSWEAVVGCLFVFGHMR